MIRKIISLLLLLASLPVGAATVNVAVASNFVATLRQLVPLFHDATGHTLRISPASTGKLYAQIRHGAPYDIFLSADAAHPGKLVEKGLAEPDSLITYAVGRLALWSSNLEYRALGPDLLREHAFKRLAIANPKTAPYGAAARQTLEELDLWRSMKGRLVRGENIGQTFQFVASGAAEIGFVALSQVRSGEGRGGYLWEVPASLYQPIRQQAVLLSRSRANEGARDFMAFLKGPVATTLIQQNGYALERGHP